MSEWVPTEDTRYSHSKGGHSTRGDFYPWMGVEEVDCVWHAFLYKVSPPRNEKGDFSYDLFPDNDENMYTLAGGRICLDRDEAISWCQQRDKQLKETVR